MSNEDRFTIRQRDGTLLGPVSFETVRYLVKAGKLAHDETIAVVGGSFHPVSTYPELAKILSAQSFAGEGQQEGGSEGEEEVLGESELLADLRPATVVAAEELGGGRRPPSYSGDLANVAVARLVYFFSCAKEVGRLELRRGPETCNIYFSDEGPQLDHGPEDDTELVEALLAQQLCTREQLEEAREASDKDGARLGDSLVASGVVPPFSVFEVLQQLFTNRLIDTFGWRAGQYRFYTGEVLEGTPIPFRTDVFDLIKQGIRTWFDLSGLRRVLEPHYESPLTKVTNRRVSLDQLKFSPREARIYNYIGRTRSLRELIQEMTSASVVDELELHQAVYFLGQIEMVLFADTYLGRRVQDEIRLLDQKQVIEQ